MQQFKQYYNQLLLEVVDSRNNRDSLIRAYGLDQFGGTANTWYDRASELIQLWNRYSPLIDKNEDYGFPRNIPNIDPRDIYSWSKVSKRMGWAHPEAIQNLEAMIENLKRVKQNKETRKQDEQNYTVIYKNEHATVYEPHSEGASCKIGAGTKWCTAATKGTNHFDSYVKDQGVRLFYILPHKYVHRGIKYAIALYPDGRRENFDEQDQPYSDEEFKELVLDRYNIDTTEWLPEYSAVEQLEKACERFMKLIEDGSTDGLDLTEAQENIMYQIMDMNETNYKDYIKFRDESGMPDRAFLAASEKFGLTNDTFQFYTTRRSNDPDWKTEKTVKSNKDFRFYFVDALQERTELAIRGYGNYDHAGSDYDVWEQVNKVMSYMKHQDRVWDLYSYSKDWAGGYWRDLHDAVLEAFEELGPTAFVEGDPGMIHGGLLRFCLLERPDNRFEEMEMIAVDHMQSLAKKMGLTHADSMVLGAPGDNEQMEQWTIELRKQGWIDFANRYNLSVAGAKGTNDKVSYIPNNPSSYAKLFEYPMG